jgi:hypothetical protein
MKEFRLSFQVGVRRWQSFEATAVSDLKIPDNIFWLQYLFVEVVELPADK